MSLTLIHPAAGRIVLREIRGSDVTAAGIILVNDVRREGHLGEVVAICDGWTDGAGNEHQSDFNVGDVVAFGKHTGTQLEIGRNMFIILMEKDIMCTLEEKAEQCSSCDRPLTAAPGGACEYPSLHDEPIP